MGFSFPRVSQRDIQNILDEPNLALRNTRVPACYFDLAGDFSQLLGSKNVNWLYFACWASNTAGMSIRNQILPGRLQALLQKTPSYRAAMKRLQNHLTGLADNSASRINPLEQCLARAFIEVSDHVSEGNRLVFEELAPLYADFIQTFAHERHYSQDRLDQFTAKLKRGKTEQGGQDHLIQAFTAYYQAMFSQGKTKAEHIFHGNLLVGLNEQIRLQGPIEGALNTPLDLVFEDKHGPSPFLSSGAREGLTHFHREIRISLGALWRRAATEMLMTLHLPGLTLHLGEDVRTVGLMFPQELRDIRNPQLRETLLQWDRTQDTTYGSGAEDWSSLADRMNYIADLFRSRQQDYAMYTAPYRRKNQTHDQGGPSRETLSALGA